MSLKEQILPAILYFLSVCAWICGSWYFILLALPDISRPMQFALTLLLMALIKLIYKSIYYKFIYKKEEQKVEELLEQKGINNEKAFADYLKAQGVPDKEIDNMVEIANPLIRLRDESEKHPFDRRTLCPRRKNND